jgi:hypothetical protein
MRETIKKCKNGTERVIKNDKERRERKKERI